MADGPIMLQKDNTFTKLFVGGLPYHTTNETLKKYFLEFGDIEEAVVIHDRVTQKSKGYGFVTMKEKEGAERACADPYPIIDGRKANVNLAYLGAKPKPHNHPTSPLSSFPIQRSDSPTALYNTAPQSSPPGLPLPPPGIFMPSPPPPPPHPAAAAAHFYQDSPPPFSPPLYNHQVVMAAPYFNGSPPPFGYLPPSPHLLQGPHHPPTFIPQIVPFNAAT